MNYKDEMLKALQCLYLEVHESIADDIKAKVMACVLNLEGQIEDLKFDLRALENHAERKTE